MITKQQVASGVSTVLAVAETIREVGECHGGTIYAALMQRGITLASYDTIIGILVRTKLVERRGDMLRWIGPAK